MQFCCDTLKSATKTYFVGDLRLHKVWTGTFCSSLTFFGVTCTAYMYTSIYWVDLFVLTIYIKLNRIAYLLLSDVQRGRNLFGKKCEVSKRRYSLNKKPQGEFDKFVLL